MVLNTSFNDKEPIICSPIDAINTCTKAGIEHLVIGSFFARVGCKQEHQTNIYSTSCNYPDLRDILIKMEKDSEFQQQLFNGELDCIGSINKTQQELLLKILKKTKERLRKARIEFQLDPETTKIKDYIISRR